MSVDEWFTFDSDAALNLHHVLYAEAWSVESAETGQAPKAQPVEGELALRDAPGFSNAIAYNAGHAKGVVRTEVVRRPERLASL